MLVLAYGQMYSINQWVGHDGPPGFSYFIQALRYLPSVHEEGSLHFVEVLCLLGYFMQNLNRHAQAFLYVWQTSCPDFIPSWAITNIINLDRHCTKNGHISRASPGSIRLGCYRPGDART
jgi:hypothetical protein